MGAEVENIISLLKRTFEKDAWHGPSVREALKDLAGEEAFSRLPDTHSIIELVAHMTAWRTYAVKKLEGEASYKVSDQMNFPDAKNWQVVLADLEESQRQLEARLRTITSEKLQEQVPGVTSPLSFYVLIHGIIHHDLYHAGQIILIRKARAKQSL